MKTTDRTCQQAHQALDIRSKDSSRGSGENGENVSVEHVVPRTIMEMFTKCVMFKMAKQKRLTGGVPLRVAGSGNFI